MYIHRCDFLRWWRERWVVVLCTFSSRSYMTFAATNVVSCVTIIKFTKLITMFIVFASDALAGIISHHIPLFYIQAKISSLIRTYIHMCIELNPSLLDLRTRCGIPTIRNDCATPMQFGRSATASYLFGLDEVEPSRTGWKTEPYAALTTTRTKRSIYIYASELPIRCRMKTTPNNQMEALGCSRLYSLSVIIAFVEQTRSVYTDDLSPWLENLNRNQHSNASVNDVLVEIMWKLLSQSTRELLCRPCALIFGQYKQKTLLPWSKCNVLIRVRFVFVYESVGACEK